MAYLINWFIEIYRNITITVLNLILAPVDLFLKNTIPDLNNFFLEVNTYLNDYLFKGLQFIKMVFLNITNISTGVWYFFLSSLLVMLFVSVNFIVLKFALNVWRLVHGNNGGKN